MILFYILTFDDLTNLVWPSLLLTLVSDDLAIHQMDGTVGLMRERLVVRHDDERVAILLTEVEKKLMQFGTVMRVE